MTDSMHELIRNLVNSEKELGEDELDTLTQSLSLLAEGVEEVAPSAGLKARLMESVAAEHRWAPFWDRVASFFDVNLQVAKSYLDRIADPTSWESALREGIALIHLEGGPALAGLDAGIVRLEAGSEFPEHTHEGPERTLILQGGYVDREGRTFRAGDYEELEAGSLHSFRALPGEDTLFAVIVPGIRFTDPSIDGLD